MSGSASLSTSSLTDAERADVRRFCGYPMFGIDSTNAQLFVFFQHFKTLEYRTTNARPEELQVIRLHLATLYGLESAMWAASGNLDTAKAAIWEHNPREVQDRTRLYNQTRRDFCGFMGIPPGPALGDGAIRLVV